MTEREGRLNLAGEPSFDLGSLTVTPSACRVSAGAEEIRIEAQTMAVLVVLARAGGATVTREELIDTCWQGRIVSDDAVGRTIAKVRALARSMGPESFSLETLPKVGYRLLATPVSEPASNLLGAPEQATPPPRKRTSSHQRAVLAAVLLAAIPGIPVIWSVVGNVQQAQGAVFEAQAKNTAPRVSDISDALFALDVARLRSYFERGWSPAWLLDVENNTALHNLMMVCERSPTHDRAGVLKVARLLVEVGADTRTRNKWGDTALMIAESPRYCGPDHPVTLYLRTQPGAGLD